MDPTEIRERVRAVVAHQLGKDPGDIADTQSLAALGVESLDAIEVIFALEEEFGIDIPLNTNQPDGTPMDSIDAATQLVVRLTDGGK